MRFEFDIEGLDKLGTKLERLQSESFDRMGKALIEAGFRIQREAKNSIAKSPLSAITGRSMPGNAPHTDTGLLVSSIYVNVEKTGDQIQSVIVGTDLKYGQYLEFGTVNIEARPWLVPAFAKTKDQNFEALKAVITRLIKEQRAA